MKVIDESDRVADMARALLAARPQEKPGFFGILESFCYSAAWELQRTLEQTERQDLAVAAAVQAYRSEQQNIIDYRRKRGLPVVEVA